eukprot:4568333-Prymnesium_polylepis.1
MAVPSGFLGTRTGRRLCDRNSRLFATCSVRGRPFSSRASSAALPMITGTFAKSPRARATAGSVGIVAASRNGWNGRSDPRGATWLASAWNINSSTLLPLKLRRHASACRSHVLPHDVAAASARGRSSARVCSGIAPHVHGLSMAAASKSPRDDGSTRC